MNPLPKTNQVNERNEKAPRKRPYAAPVLTKYGDIASLTHGAGNQTTDGTGVST